MWGRANVDTGERTGVNADEHAGRDGVRAGRFDLLFCRRCPPPPFLSSPSFMDRPRPRRGGHVVAIAGVVLVRRRLPAVLVISVVTVDGDTYYSHPIRKKKLTCWVGVDTLDRGPIVFDHSWCCHRRWGWRSCTVAVDDARGRVDVIHSAEGKSVSSICTTSGAHLSWPSSTTTTTVPQKEGGTGCSSSFLLR